MKRRSWKRTERDGRRPVPKDVIPYREWCQQKGLDPETEEAWNKWVKAHKLEDLI